MTKYLSAFLPLFLAFVTSLNAETIPTPSDSTSLTRKERVAKRNLHYNILGGPGYTPDFGIVIGGSALMTFKINPSDSTQLRSVLPFAMAFMFDGGINFVVKPQLFFKGDKFRIFGSFTYKNSLSNFYGVGYSTNKDYERDESTSEYDYKSLQINPWFMFRLGRSNFFLGPQFDFNYEKIKNPAPGMVTQADYVAAGGTEVGYTCTSTGVGFLLTYDSRDVPANAYKGTYLDCRALAYTKLLGDHNFYKLEIDFRKYHSLGRRKVLAWTLQTKNVFHDVPLTQYTLIGTPFDLRGYYMGQYRDKSSHIALVEYRHMINTDKSTKLKGLLSHVGYVAWGGCGFMGPTMGKVEGVLPNAGVGLRIEIQPRMNLRMDFGRDFTNNQNLFYLNMTEAF